MQSDKHIDRHNRQRHRRRIRLRNKNPKIRKSRTHHRRRLHKTQSKVCRLKSQLKIHLSML